MFDVAIRFLVVTLHKSSLVRFILVDLRKSLVTLRYRGVLFSIGAYCRGHWLYFLLARLVVECKKAVVLAKINKLYRVVGSKRVPTKAMQDYSFRLIPVLNISVIR